MSAPAGTGSVARAAVRRRVPRALLTGLRGVARGVGRTTALLRTWPTFLIVGAQRCGTTSLFKALMQHPQVAGPLLAKGVHYFDIAYGRDPAWYRSHFPLRLWQCSARDSAAVAVGESSPYYLFHPRAAQRIAELLPEVRVVVALRDPVERAYSAHAHELARGFERFAFADALRMEEERLSGQEEKLLADPTARSFSHQHHAYLRRGRYAEQLRRLERHIPRDRIHVVDSERFFGAPEAEFAALERFLGLAHCPQVRFDRHNARPRAHLDPELAARLRAYFAPHDEDLVRWLGWRPGWCEGTRR